MDAYTHHAETHVRLTTSPVVLTFTILEERLGVDYGYLRVQVELINRDYLEMAEYFVVQASAIVVQRYRHHWMEPSQRTLKKRWDNARHHPHLPNFPHHIHDGDELNVIPGTAMQMIDVIAYLEKTLT
jgi:hypothetical protein